MPLVSICILSRNRATKLQSTLQHVSEFSAFDFEVVVSDNCSDDATAQVVDSFRDRIERLYYVRQPEALNFFQTQQPPFNLAVGDYLIYLADDDRLKEDGVARAVAALEADPGVALAYGGWESVAEDFSVLYHQYQLSGEVMRVSLASLQQDFSETYSVEMPLLRRTVYEKALAPLNDQYAFDLYGMARMLQFGDALILPWVIHQVAQHEGQASRDLFREDILGCYLADYELTAACITDLAPLERAWYITRKIAMQYLCAAKRAYDSGNYLRARVLVQRAMPVRPDLAAALAQQIEEGAWQLLVAEAVMTFVRTAPPVQRIVVESSDDGITVANALCQIQQGIEVQVGGSDELMFLPYHDDEFFLYASDDILAVREAISDGPIRKRRSLASLREAVRIGPLLQEPDPCVAASM